ncbi:MAG: SDR family oxidoreductase [Acidobacteria bacterium]|nr:SDR family oxidoreductase [Acidobacteriota bacterium]
MDLQGKAAFVNGTKRLGAAIALALARGGADVAVTYRASRAESDAAAKAIAGLGRRSLSLELDLNAPESIERAIAAAASAFGRLDILVNVASIYRKSPPGADPSRDWDENMGANARGAYLCALAAAPHMRRQGGGRVVNFADWLPASRRPRYPGYPTYYVSKAAVVAMTESLALELAKDAILVNAIAPGPILPHEGITPEEDAEVRRNTPLGRWGGEQSIVQAVLALLSCDFVTGEVLRVDGGRHLR